MYWTIIIILVLISTFSFWNDMWIVHRKIIYSFYKNYKCLWDDSWWLTDSAFHAGDCYDTTNFITIIVIKLIYQKNWCCMNNWHTDINVAHAVTNVPHTRIGTNVSC